VTQPLNPQPSIQSVEVERWNGAAARRDTDALVVEEPLEIRVNEVSLAVTMRTPGQDEALAAGFLATEGIVRSPDDIFDITSCADPQHPDLHNIVTVYVPPERVPTGAPTGRQRYASSSCGLCGKATIEAIRVLAPPIESAPALSRAVLYALPDRLRAEQRVFARTGGLHAAGLFDMEGNPLCVEEDVGRHNTVDKLIGRALLDGRWPLDATILMVSGRAGFEIVQKALVARIPAVCAVSAPSTLAADLARAANMTLIGFLRGDTMNVYAGKERIIAFE
jgi:FdhD protein